MRPDRRVAGVGVLIGGLVLGSLSMVGFCVLMSIRSQYKYWAEEVSGEDKVDNLRVIPRYDFFRLSPRRWSLG